MKIDRANQDYYDLSGGPRKQNSSNISSPSLSDSASSNTNNKETMDISMQLDKMRFGLPSADAIQRQNPGKEVELPIKPLNLENQISEMAKQMKEMGLKTEIHIRPYNHGGDNGEMLGGQQDIASEETIQKISDNTSRENIDINSHLSNTQNLEKVFNDDDIN
jgi:hypothetical protein